MGTVAPLVSIGMPVRNGERFLPAALDAILSQTFQNFEIVISDNASGDATPEICRGYAASDSRIRYFRNETDLGAARNYNRVFHLARGKYFRWAAHDDLCSRTHLERCVDVLEHMPSVVLCYPRTMVIDEDGNFVCYRQDGLDLRAKSAAARYSSYHARFRASRKCDPVFGLIRSCALACTPLIGNYLSSDEVLIAELALRGEFYELPEALFMRRDHPGTSTRRYPTKDEGRAVWFDTRKKGKLLLPHWRLLREHVAVLKRVPLPPRERVRCAMDLTKWMIGSRRDLLRELMRPPRYVASRLSKPLRRSLRGVLGRSRAVTPR